MTRLTDHPGPERARAPDSLDIRLHAPASEVVVVRVAGAVEARSAPLLAERVGQQLFRAPHVVVDLGDVTSLGVSGLRILSDLSRRAARMGVCLYLAADHPAVCRALHRAGLDQVLILGESADLILASLMCGRSTVARARDAYPRPRTQLDMLISNAVDGQPVEQPPRTGVP